MIVNKYTKGGGSSGVTPEQVQAQIDSALTPFWDSANTEDAISAATSGKADAANLSMGDTNPGDLWFPKWNEQGIITGKTGLRNFQIRFDINGMQNRVTSPDNSHIPSIYAPTTSGNPGEFLVSTGNGAPVWSAVTMGGVSQEYVDSAITQVQDQLDTIDEVIPAAIVDLNERVDEISGSTPDLSNFWTSAQTEDAISAATSGKADAENVSANTDRTMFPRWNKQGIVTGIQAQVFKNYLDVNDVGGPLTFYTNSTVYGTQERALKFYAPVSAGTAGEVLVSTGSGAPVWSAVTFPANTKILVDFDKTPQSERAALYADLKALYDGGSGSSINKLYDFYKTVNTWQGQKIDYYTFSGNTLVFGQVVSPENVTDHVVYVQVMEIDSAGNVNVVTNAIGASGGGVTQEYVDSAVTILQNQIDLIDEVIPAAIVDINNRMVSSSSVSTLWRGTQAQYDAIITKDPNTLYIIVNE